jgi:hypothetical protein
LPADLQQKYSTGFATYAAQAMNWRGRTAGLSNQLKVPLAPAPPPPQHVRAELTAGGIIVEFDCLRPNPPTPALIYKCRLYRQAQGGGGAIQDVAPGQPPCDFRRPGNGNTCRIADNAFEWEKSYSYWVVPVTEVMQDGQKIAEVEGDNSPAVTVFARDIFPPGVPSGLEAVASGVGQKPFIDLTWTPDTEADLAGYNVYRQEAGAATWQKIDREVVTAPAFRDETVAAGHTYTYAVTARDVRGNESARSQPATEPVP